MGPERPPAGRVVIVPIGTDAVGIAGRVAAGSTVIFVATADAAAEAGAHAAALEASAAGRVAVYVVGPGDEGLDGLDEFVGELFNA